MVCKYLQSGEVKNCGKKREEELWPAENYKLQHDLYLQVFLCLYLYICIFLSSYLYLYLQVKNCDKKREKELWCTEKYKIQLHLYLQVYLGICICICIWASVFVSVVWYLYLYMQVKKPEEERRIVG